MCQLQEELCIVLVPSGTDRHLLSNEVIKVPSSVWKSAEQLFRGTVIVGTRMSATRFVLHDVAVTAGLSFVGAKAAPMRGRLDVLERVANTMTSLLNSQDIVFCLAPCVACVTPGKNQGEPGSDLQKDLARELMLDEGLGLWLVRAEAPFRTCARSSKIEDAKDVDGACHDSNDGCRRTWIAQPTVRLCWKFGKWHSTEPSGEQVPFSGDGIELLCPIALDDIPPCSIGVFQVRRAAASPESATPLSELVLTKVLKGDTLWNTEVPVWSKMRLYCDDTRRIRAVCDEVQHTPSWDDISRFILGFPEAPAPLTPASPPATRKRPRQRASRRTRHEGEEPDSVA